MEKNYNFKFNLEEPGSEDIRQRMDFDALLQEALPATEKVAKRARIRRLAYIASAAAAAVLLLILIPFLSRQSSISPEAYFAKQDYVNPPVPEMQLSFQTDIVADAYKGDVINYPSGSRIVIPAAAFMNDRGRLIGGEVEIHYRELHDYIDFFVSGIPLAYDSVGMQRYLTSAGMVEVYAEQNGRRLRLAPGKAIQVELHSEVPVDDYFSLPEYHVYQLDTAARSWRYSNVDILQFLEDDEWIAGDENAPQRLWLNRLAELEQAYQKELQDLQITYPLPAAPLKPTQASGNRPTLELDFVNGNLPLDPASDLQPEDLNYLHEGTIWEVAPESPEVDSRAFSVSWQSIRLRRINAQLFELTLQHSQNEETILVSPVLLGAAYQQAMDRYVQEQTAYDLQVRQREGELANHRDSLELLYTNRKASLQEQLGQELQSRPGKLRRKVVNRFIVSSFGVWNCAQPIAAPETVQGVRYLNQNGEAIENTTAYVVNQEQNTVFRYLASSTAPLGILPATNNLLWIVNEEGGISVAHVAQLQGGGAELVLKTIAPPAKNRSELRKALSF